jgi:methyltransferase (TIGR00027 family)
MTERAASSTAVLVCQGRASVDGRYAVGRFHDPIAWELLDPVDRGVVEDVRAERVPRRMRERMTYEMVRRTGLLMLPRTICIDDAIREHAAGQVVILGAGLDGRAWRMPELARAAVFEVDHAASQADKLRRAGGLVPTAGRVVPVAVDLAHEPLGPALEKAGFDRSARTTWVWEGVVPYLSAAQVRTTLAQIADRSAPGSRVVVQYQRRSATGLMMQRVMPLVFRLFRASNPLAGEPWRSLWRPERFREMLDGNGFDVVSDRDLLALSEDVPSGDNNGPLRNARVAVAVRR